MSTTPTLGDVAKAAQVHPGTASRALNEETRHKVAPQTVHRVLAEAERLGYTPNVVARGLRKQRSQTIGVLIPDLTNSLFPPIVRGIEDALARRGFTAFVSNTDNDVSTERRAFDALRARQVDGFIFANARRDHPLVEEAFDAGIPAVLANRRTDRDLYPWVAGDDDSGIRQVVNHLYKLGHRHIAHVAGPQNNSAGFARSATFRRHTSELGMSEIDCPIVGADVFDTNSGAAATRHILDHFNRTTAIVCANDMMAVGALGAMREAGIDCPAQMSLVGFNDMPLAQYLAPSLTTVRAPSTELGTIAATMLLDLLEGRPTTREVLLPVELEIRQSTAVPRMAGVAVGHTR